MQSPKDPMSSRSWQRTEVARQRLCSKPGARRRHCTRVAALLLLLIHITTWGHCAYDRLSICTIKALSGR